MSFDTYFKECLNSVQDSRVKAAMAYSLFSKGKHIRSKLLLACLKTLGVDETIGYPSACAIEMIHTYSLIHDDLPAMDDDTLRRGKPTCHIAFDEATAILAGDALLTQAFLEASKSECCNQIIALIADYSGANGMVLGQIYDLAFENQTDIELNQLIYMQQLKTGKLLTLPLLCGAVLAKREELFVPLIQVGMKMGLLFQIQDDLLDVLSTQEMLGKNIGSDESSHKTTYVSLCGINQAQKDVEILYQEAMDILAKIKLDNSELSELLTKISKRKY